MISGRVVALASVVLAASCVHTQETRKLVGLAPAKDTIVIRDVRVFPATGPDVIEHQDVVVQGEKIVAVRATGEPIPAGAVVFEGAGRTLLPGFVDAHVHTQVTGAPPWYTVWPEPEHVLEEALYSGTTTVHDLGGPVDAVTALKGRVERREIPGPRVFVAGPLLTAKDGYPLSFARRTIPWPLNDLLLDDFVTEIESADQATAVVNALADAHVDLIKLVIAETPDGTPTLSAALVFAITKAAHARGLRVVAHVDTAANAERAVAHGVDVLAHGVHSTELSDAEADRIGASVRAIAPTLITFERLYEMRNDKMELSEMERQTVAADLQREVFRARESGYDLDDDLESWLGHLDVHHDARMGANVKKLADRGAHVLVGTDGHGSVASFPAAYHREMRLLHAAGLSNAQVLLGATAYGAHMISDAPTFGTIEVGKDADLVLVEGDPLEDLANTERIVQVIARGRLVRRAVPVE